MLNQIKTILGIKDVDKDTELNELIAIESGLICLYIGETVLPTELAGLVVDGVVARYRRKGKEGMTAESIESHSSSFETGEKRLQSIQPYLDRWMALNKPAPNPTGLRSFRMRNH